MNKLFAGCCDTFTDLINSRKLWVVIPSLIIGLFMAVMSYHSGWQEYTELTAGAITWQDEAKLKDYIAILVFLIVVLSALGILNYISNQLVLSDSADLNLDVQFRNALLLSSCPAVFYVLNSWSYSLPIYEEWLFLSFLLIMVTVAPLLKWRSIDRKRLSDCYSLIVANTAVSIIASLFTTAGLYLAGLRYKAYVDEELSIRTIKLFSVTTGSLLLASLLAIYLLSKDINGTLHKIKKHAVIAQLGAPLLFLVLLPAPWAESGLEGGQQIPSVHLYYFVAILTLLGFIQLARQLFSLNNTDIVIKTMVMAAIIIAIKMPALGVPVLSSDDYHLGEVYLPWMQYQKFDQVFYSDYSPARGLNQALLGYLGSLFFDGSAAAIFYAEMYAGSLLIVAFAVVATWAMGPLFAIVALVLIPFPVHLILEFLIALILMLDARVIKRPYFWTALYAVLSVAFVLYRPQTAPAFVIALSVIFLYLVVKSYQDHKLPKYVAFMVALVAASQIINLYIPLNQMVFGVIKYIIDQASVNTVAHTSLMSSVLEIRSGFTLHMMRLFAFILLIYICVLVIKEMGEKRKNTQLLLALSAIGIFLLVLIPYLYGRVGQSAMRGPIYSVYYMAILVPYVFYIAKRITTRAQMVYASMFVCAVFYPQAEIVSSRFVANFKYETPVSDEKIVNGRSSGVPNYGIGYGKQEHLNKVASVKKVMDYLLRPEQTYLDLTNRNALYFYTERKVPLTSGAIYNLPSTKLQMDALAKIQGDEVPVVLAGHISQRFDGGSPSVRAHSIYRYVINNYVPIVIDSDIVMFLSRKLYEEVTGKKYGDFKWGNQVHQFKYDAASDGLIPTDHSNMRNIDIADKLLHQKYLKKLPVAWGRSVDALISSGAVVKAAQVNVDLNVLIGKGVNLMSVDDGLRIQISNMETRPDILNLKLSCDDGVINKELKIVVKMRINNDVFSTPYNIELSGEDSVNLLIPMDVAPSWTIAGDILALNMFSGSECKGLRINSVRGYMRGNNL